MSGVMDAVFMTTVSIPAAAGDPPPPAANADPMFDGIIGASNVAAMDGPKARLDSTKLSC